MYKKFVAVLVIAITFALPQVKGQSVKTVRGSVLTADQRPVMSAAVACMSTGKTVQATQTDSAGHFILYSMLQGAYQLHITMSGYKDTSLALTVDSLSPETITLPPIMISPSVMILDEVTVTGKKALIEHKLDRTVINADALISGAGLNVLELLERSPGVIVDAGGNISMAGKTGVLVLIDGKPSYLSGEQLATYLKSLPASMLDRIELMPNPPAKYDAAGTGGVIDIRTKKSRAKGWLGAVALNAGTSRAFRGSGSVNLNYYKGKTNLFGNIGYAETNSHRILELERNYYSGGQLTTRYVQVSEAYPYNKSKTIKLGADYFVSPKTTLGFVFNGSFAPGRYVNPVQASLYNAQGALDSTLTADNTSVNTFNNTSLNLNFLRRLDSAGSTLSADLDWVKYSGTALQDFVNSTWLPDKTLTSFQVITADLPVDINIRTAKTDYSRVFKNKSRLDLGAKSSWVIADNTACYYNWINTVPVADDRNTNQFHYEENIYAGYANFNREGHRFSFQAGLRMENTNIRARQFGNPVRKDSAFGQRYTNIFPTAFISYKLNAAGYHVLHLSYGRRIDRPYYKDLNPFIYIVDRYTWFSGNPLLQPQVSSNYSMTYRYRSVISASMFYNHYKGYQTEAIFEEGGIFINRPTNIGKRIYQGISATATLKPAKFWRNNMYTEVVNMKFIGQLINTSVNTNSTYFYIESGNQLDLGKSWTLEISGFYITRRIAAQFNLDEKGQLAIGVQKKFWQNKVSARCSVSDIFLTNMSRGSLSNITGATSFYRSDMDTRMINFGLSLNFGKAPGATPKSRSTGSSQPEQNRVKN